MNKEDIKISIIIPIYNSSQYLERCIESIINQTYGNIELILVNDGSTDNSAEICRKYEKKDKRVKYFYQENSGSSMARNNGIYKATGKFIMFVDSDDSIDEEMLSFFAKKIKEFDFDFIISGLKMISQDNKIRKSENLNCTVTNRRNIAKSVLALMKNERMNSPVAKLYKRSIILENSICMPKGIHLNEDLNFNIDYLKCINNICIMDGTYYNYFYNSNSVTGRYYPNRYNMLNLVNSNIIDYFESTNLTKCELGEIYYLYVKLVYSSFINFFHRDCKLTRSEKIKSISTILESEEFKRKIEKAYRNELKYKILLSILKTKRPILIYSVCSIMKYLREKKILKY